MNSTCDGSTVGLLGGSGFIGSCIARRLWENGRTFSVLDARESLVGWPTIITDVTEPEALRRGMGSYDILVNLAAEHRDDVRPVSRYHEVNVEGARNVCQMARMRGIQRIVFTSSVAVYGFPEPGADESAVLQPFNEYGRTKAEAEGIYREWQEEDPQNRTLVIVRPTVVFGEGNRGNVFNLLKQVHSGRFLMVGSGQNRKSMAYVENIAAFVERALDFPRGVHVYNYVDKPDLDMNGLVAKVNQELGKTGAFSVRIPYSLGYVAGRCFDLLATVTGRSFPVSAVRVEKFCADTSFGTSVDETGFERPYSLEEGLERTIRYEFVDKTEGPVFYTE